MMGTDLEREHDCRCVLGEVCCVLSAVREQPGCLLPPTARCSQRPGPLLTNANFNLGKNMPEVRVRMAGAKLT